MDDVAGHYSRLAPSYDRLWSVDEDFVEDTAAAIVTALDLGADDRLVDLGGGTGLHAAAIAARVGFPHPPLVVDPSPDLLARFPPGSCARARPTRPASPGGPSRSTSCS